MESPEQPGDPVAAYLADWTPDPPADAGTSPGTPGPDGPPANPWTRASRLVPVLLALAALVVVAVVVSRRGSTVNTNDADSVRTSAGSTSTSSTRPEVVTILATPGTAEPGTTPGTAIPAAPSTVVAPIVASGPRPAAAAVTTTSESTTTTSGPCHPDLAVSVVENQPIGASAFTVTVENLAPCDATDAVVTVDLAVGLAQAPTLSAGQWSPLDPSASPSDAIIAGTWTIGALAGNATAHADFSGHPHGSSTGHTGTIHVDAAGQQDGDPSNNDVSNECAASLTIAIRPPAPVGTDGSVNVDVVLHNDGPCPTLPLTLQVMGHRGSSGSGQMTDNVEVPADGQDHVVRLSFTFSGGLPSDPASYIALAQNRLGVPVVDWIYASTSYGVPAL